MNFEVLKERYQQDTRILQMADQLSMPRPQQVFIDGLSGSAGAFVLNALFQHQSGQPVNQDPVDILPPDEDEEPLAGSATTHIVILNDQEQAAYFHNTLESLTDSALNLIYFPSSFKNKKNYRLLNSSHVMLRAEALAKLAARTSDTKRSLIITYPEALFEKVVVAKELSANTIFIKQAETIDLQSLLELLVMLGFDRTDFVYEPGQFALRGGILDIYSFGNEKPYRVELFGNEVDSIRIFDAESQLSEKRLLQVNIIPNVDTQFDGGEKISLPQFLDKGICIWNMDWEFIKERIELEEEALDIFLAYHADEPVANTTLDEDLMEKKQVTREDFISAVELEKQISRYHQVSFTNSFAGGKKETGKKKLKGTFVLPAATTDVEINSQPVSPSSIIHDSQLTIYKIAFHCRPQPSFNRNFNLLIADLKDKERLGYVLYIFAEQAKQLERLYTIFKDLNTEISFVPVPLAIHEGFIDEDLKLICYTDHQIFQRYHKYKVKQAFSKNKALTLKTLRELQPGDYVTHIDHGVGIYSGLQKVDIGGKMQEAVRLRYKDNDLLYVNISSLHKISKYTGKEGHEPKMNKLGSDVWSRLKEKTTRQIKDIAEDLIKLYAERKAQKGFAHAPDNYMQTELEASFIYEDTPDQAKATSDVKRDMEKDSPMDRLVCGDVGFGKTEIAIRAAFKTCIDGKQAAVLVPTTILAYQHYKTFQDRLKDFPVTVDFVNRFKSAKDKKETLQKLGEGKIDIIIGTHALLGKDVKFKDLGIMIIDEEQKFGVASKEKLKHIRTTVDCLTLTATPIPRTLQFSLMGARDLSIINTPPANRQPVQTEVHGFNEDFIREAIYFETERGGQVFFIHNRVASLPEMAGLIRGLCPDVSVAFAHGQMEGDQLEDTILDFMDRKYDVLVCTNIVESGVDIPNVNTIMINNAHQFGLSDLHQLRGRVGRSNKKAFCYLLAPSLATLTSDSRKRLSTLEQFSDLGSGFQIAMRDLDIRGAGNMLGGEQSGFIAEIGFEMYHKILDEAIRDLKRKKFRDVFKEEIQKEEDFVSDCTIDTDLEILIPDRYVENITERLVLYTQLDNCEDEAQLQEFHTEMADRFGPVPLQVEDLFTTVRCRRMGITLGFEKMLLKDNVLKCFFINNHESPYFQSPTFKKILEFINTQVANAKLKQVGKNGILVVDNIKTMNDLFKFLSKVSKFAGD